MISRTNNIVSSGSVSPSIEGRRGMKASVATTEASASQSRLALRDWGWISFLKILIAVLTALAGALGVASCAA